MPSEEERVYWIESARRVSPRPATTPVRLPKGVSYRRLHISLSKIRNNSRTIGFCGVIYLEFSSFTSARESGPVASRLPQLAHGAAGNGETPVHGEKAGNAFTGRLPAQAACPCRPPFETPAELRRRDGFQPSCIIMLRPIRTQGFSGNADRHDALEA